MSNIKEIPLILTYSLQISLQNGTHKELEFRLNNFINSKSSNNPFDTFKFLYSPKNKKIHFISRRSRCVKYCDNFFTFFFHINGYEYNYDDQAVRIDFIYSESFDRILLLIGLVPTIPLKLIIH